MAVRPKLTLERTFRAPIDSVWELWTTPDGIESWWGPDGFTVRVRSLDLRPGGRLFYAMIATAPDQIDFLQKAGMPATTEHSLTFVEVDAPHRLMYRSLTDFIPGVEAYEIETVIELSEAGGATRLVLTFDAMHDDRWTGLATMGHEMELNRLEKVLASR